MIHPASIQEEPLFHGVLAEEYAFLLKVCPQHLVCAQEAAKALAALPLKEGCSPYQVLEIGCGSGISTHLFLEARDDVMVHGMDIAKAMLEQAEVQLKADVESGRLRLQLGDVLDILPKMPEGSVDVVISNYAIHNLLELEREKLIPEILRVLRPGGIFINGDRYGVDDPSQHLEILKEEIKGYFRIFPELGRLDLLEAWVLHVLSDESLERVMRLDSSLKLMKKAGFDSIEILYREGINTVLSARKPV